VLYLGILWMSFLVLVLVLGILWMSQRNHPLGRCRETMDSQGSDVGSGLGWDVYDVCRGYVVCLSLVTGKRHLVSRSGAQQVCTLDLLNC
jgi:hypothetical protein